MQRKRLYLMPDYGSSSLWWEGGGMVQLDGLPLSKETTKALEAWSGHMWRALNASTGGGPPIDEEAYDAEMQVEGDRLHLAVRSELPDDFEVGRFVGGQKRIDWSPHDDAPGDSDGTAPHEAARRERFQRIPMTCRVETVGDMPPGHTVTILGAEASVFGIHLDYSIEPSVRFGELCFAATVTDEAGGSWDRCSTAYGPDWEAESGDPNARTVGHLSVGPDCVEPGVVYRIAFSFAGALDDPHRAGVVRVVAKPTEPVSERDG